MKLDGFRDLHDRLLAAHGPQDWWPGDTPFEIMVGAVLTQNTAWTNVEKAIARLIDAHSLDAATILALAPEALAELIRPAGYFNVKARRLQSFCRFYLEAGGLETLARIPTDLLRPQLLAVHGIGPETADDILLYALHRPVFVVDAYTRRIGERVGLLRGGEGYDQIRLRVETELGPDAALFNELHALIVIHDKNLCRKKPDCAACCLRADCRSGLVRDAG